MIVLKTTTFLMIKNPNPKSVLVILSSIGLIIIVIVCRFVTYCESIREDEEDKQSIVNLSADGMGLSYFGGVTVKIF